MAVKAASIVLLEHPVSGGSGSTTASRSSWNRAAVVGQKNGARGRQGNVRGHWPDGSFKPTMSVCRRRQNALRDVELSREAKLLRGDRDHSLPEARTACQKSTPRNMTMRTRRISPHPLESRALSFWGVSRSESLTSKPIGSPPASSVSLKIAKDFVKSSCRESEGQ
jgi:hypothetical protein